MLFSCPPPRLRHLNRAGTSSSTSVEMTELRNKGANRVADMESDYTGTCSQPSAIGSTSLNAHHLS